MPFVLDIRAQARKAAAAKLQTYCKMWVYKMMYRNKKRAAQKVPRRDIRRDIRRDLRRDNRRDLRRVVRRVEPASYLGDLSRRFLLIPDPAPAAESEDLH